MTVCMTRLYAQCMLQEEQTLQNMIHTSPMAFSEEQARSLNGLHLSGNLGSISTKDTGSQGITKAITE